ncbi:putative adenylate cyclase [Gordonia araii NBRC 100433]|uniref:Putative adenylate cyclase n=1 Tax=Gordonia araii NBRC 100433 TaxID=1073574 RepID=G7H6X2_9ACTN|nr:adenylate/guanylate cyclase domain-containing protein [Gordonia araii]NNG96014.1 adenylate/guanylate cyclase domain-containing protein [Gordonia araii NBRC 100433]GAB11597.1 putative adenylate cyclase [Gordonia araii NBRC 100433]
MTESPGEPRYSRDELTAALGASPERVERLWNAFGFARRHTDAKIFSQRDLDALRLLADSSQVVPETEQVATARAVGQTMARLADWQADMLLNLADDDAISWTVDDMARAMGAIQQMVWRRHLEAALERDEEDVDAASAESQRIAGVRTTEAVGFADIVGFTSLSRRIDMAELEVLLEAFEDRVHAVITAHGGQVIKTLGDAVLFVNTDVGEAALTALEIQEDVADVEPVPPLRVGLAYGEILNRHGDVFGEPVNIASRLCGSARPGTILVDAELAEAVGDDERFRLRSISSLSVRGYRRLRASTLGRPRDRSR